LLYSNINKQNLKEKQTMDWQTCENCARRNKETGKCTLPGRDQMARDGWCYRWLEEDPENEKVMGIGEDVWNVINKAVRKED
jgi:hypothetical protein